jgi:hypothetical protein
MSRAADDKETGRLGGEGETSRDPISPTFWRRWGVVVFILLGSALMAVAAGWIVARLNVAGIAPVGILPLVVGATVGSAAFWLFAQGGVLSRAGLATAAVVVAILTVMAEHAWLYQDFCRQWREARSSQARMAMFRPEEPWSVREYVRREASPGRVAFWCVDGTILVLGAVGAALVWRRRELATAIDSSGD